MMHEMRNNLRHMPLVLLLGSVAWSQMLPSVGDGQAVWLVVPNRTQRSVAVLHQPAQSAPYVVRPATELNGRLLDNGVAGGAGRLWLVFEGMNVRMLRPLTGPVTTEQLYDTPKVCRGLPASADLLALADADGELFALLQARDDQSRAALDEALAPQPMEVEAVGDAPSDIPPAPAGFAAGTPASPSTLLHAAPAPPAHAQRLALLKGERWEALALPADWSAQVPAWLAVRRAAAQWPLLITQPEPARLRVYERIAEQWHKVDYQLPAPLQPETLCFCVDQQLILAQRDMAAPNQLKIDLSLLRKGQTHALSSVVLEAPPTQQWTAAAFGQRIGVVNFDTAGRPQLALLALDEAASGAVMPMDWQTPAPFVYNPNRMLPVAVLMASVLLMFLAWQRDPQQNKLSLPDHLTLADLLRRGGAALIDLAPCAIITSMVFGIRLGALPQHWPGLSGSWQSIAPGGLVIGLFVLHTTLTELFTGRSLGKMMLGLQVTRLDGSAPNVWQVLFRNLTKVLDLTVWYVLPVLAMVSPHRQRLGDLIARTVVVAPRNPDDDQPADEDQDDG